MRKEKSELKMEFIIKKKTNVWKILKLAMVKRMSVFEMEHQGCDQTKLDKETDNLDGGLWKGNIGKLTSLAFCRSWSCNFHNSPTVLRPEDRTMLIEGPQFPSSVASVGPVEANTH